MKKFISLLALGLFLMTVSFSLSTPVRVSALADGAVSSNPPGCGGLGLTGLTVDDIGSFGALTSNDFRIVVASRARILIVPTNTSKPFLNTGATAPTFGDIFGQEGCYVSDVEMDGSVTFDRPQENFFTVDRIRTQDGTRIVDQVDDLINGLGQIDTGGTMTAELRWIFGLDGPGTSAGARTYAYWDGADGEWKTSNTSNVANADGSQGVQITSIENQDMFNYSLRASGAPGSVVLTSTDNNNAYTFTQANQTTGPLAGRVAFLRSTTNPDEGLIALPAGTTIEAFLANTGFVRMEYFENPSDTSPVDLLVLGGAGVTALETSLPVDSSGAAVEGGSSCEGVVDFAFNFILCPLLIASNEMISWLDNRIFSALEVESKYFDNEQIRESWGNIRNVAYLLLIPVMLLMVIGTALQFKFVDAYTVKRAMPRLLVAVLFIALSYDICRIMIEVSNGVGRGVAGLIAQPFGGMNELRLDNIFNPGAGSALISFGVLGALILGSTTNAGGAVQSGLFDRISSQATTVGFIGLGITLGIVALILLAIFLLLALREMFIVFLLVVSPVAILSWIFPGNDKLWKIWWNSFSKLLMLFPLIAGFIAGGRAFATLVGDAGNADPVFGTLIKLVAVIFPYFFIPKAFQMAGGAFANVAGMVNNREKGVLDRLRKRRSAGMDQRRKKEEHGEKPFAGGNATNFRGKMNQRALERFKRQTARKDVGLGAMMNPERREAAIKAAAAKMDKRERDHILKDEALAAYLGYDDLTGLTAAVRTGDWGTLRQALVNKYGYTGDIDAAMASIQASAEAGDLRGALAKTYQTADHVDNKERAFNGDSAFLNSSVEQMMDADRKFTDEALNQALVLKAMGGGTFYRDSESAWFAARAATTDHHGVRDFNAMADMAVQGRQMLMSTGRVDQGGASFGATMGIDSIINEGLQALSGGHTYDVRIGDQTYTAHNEDELRQLVGRKLVHTSIEQNGLAVFAHQSMKTGNLDMVDNVIPVMQQRLQVAWDNAIANGETETIRNEDGSVSVVAASEAYKAEVAAAEGLWKSLGQTKPEAQKIFAQNVIAYSPDSGRAVSAAEQNDWTAATKRRAEALKYKASGEIPISQTYSDGTPIELNSQGYIIVPEPTAPMTTLRAEVGRLTSDPVYQNHSFQFTQAEQMLAQQSGAAQAQAQAQQNGPVRPYNPGPRE